jgi:hypothetical protein
MPEPRIDRRDVLAPLLLGVDAGHVAHGVGQAHGVAVGIGLRRDHRYRAGGLRQALAGLGHDGRVLAVGAGGDEDGVEIGLVFRMGGGRQAKAGCAQQQGATKREGHGTEES